MKHITPTLTSHIDLVAIHQLVHTIANKILHDPRIEFRLDACELQPTTRVASLAATAAVSVILAHEIGQDIAQEIGKEIAHTDDH